MTATARDDQDLRGAASVKLLTTSEVADLLRCSAKTILRRVQTGKLPAIKEGGRYLFDAEVMRARLVARIVRPKGKSKNLLFDKNFVQDRSNSVD